MPRLWSIWREKMEKCLVYSEWKGYVFNNSPQWWTLMNSFSSNTLSIIIYKCINYVSSLIKKNVSITSWSGQGSPWTGCHSILAIDINSHWWCKVPSRTQGEHENSTGQDLNTLINPTTSMGAGQGTTQYGAPSHHRAYSHMHTCW